MVSKTKLFRRKAQLPTGSSSALLELQQQYYIVSSLREPRFVVVPIRFASEAWPRPGKDSWRLVGPCIGPLPVHFWSLSNQHGHVRLQGRPAHAKPDFNWLSGPTRACGISCLRSLAPMRRLQCSNTQATFTNPPLLRATPLLRGMF